MLAPDEAHSSALAAQYIVEEAGRSLSEHLLHLRIRKERISIRPVFLSRVTEPVPAESNAHALHIRLRGDAKAWSHDMRPTSLWLIAAHEDRILVLASGSDAWEYKRMELAQALERMKDVLGTI